MDSKLHNTSPARPLPSCPYEAEADLQQMYGLLMEARSQTDDWRYWHVGELAFGLLMIDCHRDPRKRVRVRHESGKVVGYALLGDDMYFGGRGAWLGGTRQIDTRH